MKVNDLVAVCYDGKWSRAMEGRVLRVSPKKQRIRVRFVVFANPQDEQVDADFTLNKDGYYSGYVQGKGEAGIMRFLGCEQGDYYAVHRKQKLTRRGYKVRRSNREPNETQVITKILKEEINNA